LLKKLLFLLVLVSLTAAALWFGKSFIFPRQPNVVVVLIDTLRADHLSVNGYERDTSPNIDKFANENIHFKYAFTSSNWTPPSVASLFTGMYANTHGIMPLRTQWTTKKMPRLSEGFRTLAEVFQENGYETAAVLANPLLKKEFGYAQGFNRYKMLGRVTGERVNSMTFAVLDKLVEAQKPFFLYVHYLDPHDPYSAPDGFSGRYSGPLKSRTYPPEQEELMRRYDEEIRYVDHELQVLFDRLKKMDLYDDSVILLVSDHGEQFKERGYQGHVDMLHVEETHIPFILKFNNETKVHNTAVSLVDAYPTLVEAAGLTTTHPMHGLSLLGDLGKREKQGLILEVTRHYNQRAFISPDLKRIIVDYPMEKGVMFEDLDSYQSLKTFDMVKDPWEQTPLNDEVLSTKLFAQFESLYNTTAALRKFYTQDGVKMDEETLKNLKTLGYF